MLLRREGLNSSSMLELGVSSRLSERFKSGRLGAGVGEIIRELRLDCLMLTLAISSEGSGLGVSDSERSPLRGLGVSVGVGKLEVAVMRFSGVRDKGLRFKFAGRGLAGVGWVTATAGVGVVGVSIGGRFSLTDGAGEGKESCASGSSTMHC
jgi:hypothetical protein